MTTRQLILIYLIAINVVTFFLYGMDKWKAKRSKWRISEATLLGLAVIGGSIGSWLGMKVWHHKTMHKKFKYGLPLILIVQIAIVFLTSCRSKQTVELSASIESHKYEPEHSCVPLVASDQRSSAPNVFLVMYDHIIRLTDPVKPRLEIK